MELDLLDRLAVDPHHADCVEAGGAVFDPDEGVLAADIPALFDPKIPFRGGSEAKFPSSRPLVGRILHFSLYR